MAPLVAVMLSAPLWKRVATPAAVMVTFLALLDAQVTNDVISNEVEFE